MTTVCIEKTIAKAIGSVHEFTTDSLIFDKGYAPIDTTYNSTTGMFVMKNHADDTEPGIVMWIRDGYLHSTTPVTYGAVDSKHALSDLITRAQSIDPTTLIRVGLVPLFD